MNDRHISLLSLTLSDLTAAELIRFLDKMYPRPLPMPGRETVDRIWYDSGKRDLIETLVNKLERENG